MAKDLTPVPSPKGDGRLLTKVHALPAHAFGRLQSPSYHFGDGAQSALMPSILDKAFKGEL